MAGKEAAAEVLATLLRLASLAPLVAAADANTPCQSNFWGDVDAGCTVSSAGDIAAAKYAPARPH